MELKMLRVKDGPLVVVEKVKELDETKEWMETNYYRPVMILLDEESGTYRVTTFLDLMDVEKPVLFRDVSFEVTPNEQVVDAYKRHWSNDADVSKD